jgi:hypothetical protein
MPLLPRAQLVGGALFRERATGLQVRDDHDLLRVHDLGRLGHEVHAAEQDHLRVLRVARAFRQFERIAEMVGDVLDVGVLVVVRQDHRLALALQPRDLGEQIDGRVDGGLCVRHRAIIGPGREGARVGIPWRGLRAVE